MTRLVQVTDNEAEKRFEARVDGELAGSAYYDTADDLIVFTHTEVDDAFEGHGVGSALARARSTPSARTDAARWSPRCPFIKGWIDRHPDYQDLAGLARPESSPQASAQDGRACARAARRIPPLLHRFRLALGVSLVPLVRVREPDLESGRVGHKSPCRQIRLLGDSTAQPQGGGTSMS